MLVLNRPLYLHFELRHEGKIAHWQAYRTVLLLFKASVKLAKHGILHLEELLFVFEQIELDMALACASLLALGLLKRPESGHLGVETRLTTCGM